MLLVFTTFPTEEEARKAAKIFVEEKLAACAKISECASFYEWKGELKEEKEWELVLKASEKNKKKVEEKLKEVHSYELPQIIFLKASASKEYGEWIRRSSY